MDKGFQGSTGKPDGEDENTLLEQAVARTLEESEEKRDAPEQEALARLHPRYGIRIKTKIDPLLKEIGQYRSMAEEVDGRYDAYVEAARQAEDKPNG